MQTIETYTIQLPDFQGPFDLLLFFIERDELDIYDIPIAKITADFLAYMRQMQALNLELASEFVWVASTLMRIKVRMLLPRKVDEQGQEEEDPRAELARQLLEYKRYKEAFEALRTYEETQMQRSERTLALDETQQIAEQFMADAELENLSLFRLLKAYDEVMRRFAYESQRPVHRIVRIPYTLEQSREALLLLAKNHPNESFGFELIFAPCQDRLEAIYRFLSLLELLQQGLLLLEEEGQVYNELKLRAVEN